MPHIRICRTDDLEVLKAGLCLVWCLAMAWLFPALALAAGGDPCCPRNSELGYLLNAPAQARFRYQVRHERFTSVSLGKEKNFFLILPPDFNSRSTRRYPLLVLLHGYNFHRNGTMAMACDPTAALTRLCQEGEEEFHWLLWEDVAVVAAAMMNQKNRTYQDLKSDVQARFEELAQYGGLVKGDYAPAAIATSIVEHNMNPQGGLDTPFAPLLPMIIVLPDGDNSFYTDEDEGRTVFPPPHDKGACDAFSLRACFKISLVPRWYMKPGALGRYESYILELTEHLHQRSTIKKHILPAPQAGIGGFSMGGFGALKIALRHPGLFDSVSSQSGLVDIELLTNKAVIKTMMPEFLEVFGHLAPLALPGSSIINQAAVQANNPVRLVSQDKEQRLAEKIYFDYGEKEVYGLIKDGNKNLEKALGVSSRMIAVQPYNGKAGHNYLFWRSRLGNVLEHHAQWLR